MFAFAVAFDQCGQTLWIFKISLLYELCHYYFDLVSRSVLTCGTFTGHLFLYHSCLARNFWELINCECKRCLYDNCTHRIPRVSCSVNVPQRSTFSPLVLIELTVPTQWEGYVLQTSLNSLFHIVKKLIFLPWFQVTMVILQTTKLYRLLW